ncbi:MAG: hypothetical protein ACFB2Z_03425 [Maricaulaceae bacterium]
MTEEEAAINWADVSDARLRTMLQGAHDYETACGGLDAIDENVASALLGEAEQFYVWDHYPKGDSIDKKTHAQFFYHCHDDGGVIHRGVKLDDEHGHFHTFVRVKGFPDDIGDPVDIQVDNQPLGDKALAHLIAVSLDAAGEPTRLFTVNRWVTGETYYAAKDVIRLLDVFQLAPKGKWALPNQWVSGLVALYRPLVESLVRERDVEVFAYQARSDKNVYKDLDLEVISAARIVPEGWIATVRAEADRRGLAPAAA